MCAGVMLALDCMPKGAALHLYGFNWSRRHWLSHAIAAEEKFVRLLAARRRLILHETACGGLRFCGGCNVVAADGGSVGGVSNGSASINGSSVLCSDKQAESAGELTTEELLFREPEGSGKLE